MNNDPLQRRMFAQQILAQHARANQPMGILASSPQLMGAVQGFKDGGQVVTAKDGKFLGFDNFIGRKLDEMRAAEAAKNTPEAINEQSQLKAAELNRGLPTGGYNNPDLSPYKGRIKNILITNPTIEYDDKTGYFRSKVKSPAVEKLVKEKEKTNIEGDNTLLQKLVKEKEETNVSSEDSFVPSDVSQGSTMAEKINEVNAEGNNIEKKDAPEEKAKVFKPTEPNIDEDFKRLTNKQKELETKINNPQEAPKVFNDWTKRINKIDAIMKKKGKEITLDDVDKEARKMAGLEDNNRYDKDRHTAFWMGLIKGGLATAAGESSNALTNIAKGLGFGVESYGKDINQINENEREDNKTLLNLKYKLMSDKKSAEVAQKTLELQYQSMLMKTEQNQSQYESNMAYQQERDKINDAYKGNTFELSLYKTMKDIGLSEKTFELNVEKFNTDVKYKEEAKKQFEKNLNAKISQGLISDEAVKILTMGDKYATFDRKAFEEGKGGITLTPLGNKLNDLWLSGKYQGKMTNLMHSVDTAMKSESYLGKKFASPEQAKEATLLWIDGGYAKNFGAIKDDIQLKDAKERRQDLVDEWYNRFTKQSTNTSHEEANKTAKEKGESTYKVGGKSFQVQ